MKYLLHGPYPEMPTGYGNQLREIMRRLAKDAGPENVALQCTAGIVRHDTTWEGMRVYGRSPYTDMAEDLVRLTYEDFGADLVITLCCPWKLHGFVWKSMRTVHLMPVDRDPLGDQDYRLLAEGCGQPAAVSRFGERVLKERGLDPVYLPHGVDTTRWVPPRDRVKLRQKMGIDHLFVAGVNGSNTDPDDRKRFFETFDGFRAFHEEHPRSVLFVHAAKQAPDGLNLEQMADVLGIGQAVVFSDQAQLARGGAPEDAMRAWYGALDVYLQLGNEGFGIPAAEAMACGTPVIAGAWCTGPELAGSTGWLVHGQRGWNNGHGAYWWRPYTDSVRGALAAALAEAGGRRAAARQHAETHLDYDRIWAEHWTPFLQDLASG